LTTLKRKKVLKRQDVFLKDGFNMVFHDNLQPAIIEITVEYKKHPFDTSTFLKIINEIFVEKNILDNEKRSYSAGVSATELRNEIFYLKDNIYKVDEEHMKDMFFASGVASGHGSYLKKLQGLVRLFDSENILLVNEHRISSKRELKEHLKSKGFYFIDKDIP
jgi:hypothetical protein